MPGLGPGIARSLPAHIRRVVERAFALSNARISPKKFAPFPYFYRVHLALLGNYRATVEA
jgi:hypothetical protein